MKRKTNQLQDILQLILILLVIVVLNYMSGSWFARWDLTSEKRYTLSENTKVLMEDLQQPVFVKVFLYGDLNSGFRNLSNSTKEMLEEMRVFGGANIDYLLVDPNEGSKNEKEALYSELSEYDMSPIEVYETREDGTKIKTKVFPYALFYHNEKQVAVNLLENLPGRSGAENLNLSMEGLEFKFTEAIRKLTLTEKPKVAFLEGHGELDELDVIDITNELANYYQVDRGQLGDDPSVLDAYKAVVIAKPQNHFSEKDKFIIDQYVMKGGRILWLVDAINITLDSLQNAPQTVGMYREINIEDMLFKYGVRINPVLLQDIQSAMISVNTAPAGQAPRLVPAPWYYSPLLNPSQVSTITRKLNVVKSEFCSVIDTVGELKLKRQLLLATSRYTKIDQVPVFVSLANVNKKPIQSEFNNSYVPVAVAEEGIFESVFKNRPVPHGIIKTYKPLFEMKDQSKMVFVADGDIIRNEVRFKDTNPQIQPLGFDELTKQEFGNKQFVLNAINYLCDDEGWMELRGRSYTLRLLDKSKLASEATFWKLLNVILPIVMVSLLGIVFMVVRKRRYAR